MRVLIFSILFLVSSNVHAQYVCFELPTPESTSGTTFLCAALPVVASSPFYMAVCTGGTCAITTPQGYIENPATVACGLDRGLPSLCTLIFR